jgi:hypothetical protein
MYPPAISYEQYKIERELKARPLFPTDDGLIGAAPSWKSHLPAGAFVRRLVTRRGKRVTDAYWRGGPARSAPIS